MILARDGDAPMGAVHATAPDEAGAVIAGIALDPAAEVDPVGTALVEALVADAHQRSVQHLELWVFGADAHSDTMANAGGLAVERELWQMRVPLPLAETINWPDGVEVRTFEPGRDEDAWLTVNNRAFAADPDQGAWTRATLEAREAEPWFDPAGFLLAHDARGLAGFCWTKVHPAAPPMDPEPLGEIYVIGVDPDHQGIGLGRALTVGGLASLHAAWHRRRDALRRLEQPGGRRPLSEPRVRRRPHRPRLRPRARVSTRYGASRADVEALLAEWGEPRYRAEQVWEALYRPAPLEDATALPRALRGRLAEALPLELLPVVEADAADGMTTKWLWGAGPDAAQVETVLMRSRDRASVCVSSQAGCAMACSFCATGQAGLERHLTSGEIVEQVVRAAHSTEQRVSNVVYMGMGEPLANYGAVWESVERLHGDLGLSARRITISTVGVVPGMRRLATEALPVTLAVSLHARRRRSAHEPRPAQPAVPDRRRARRRGRGRRGPRPTGDVRVRVHRGDQ